MLIRNLKCKCLILLFRSAYTEDCRHQTLLQAVEAAERKHEQQLASVRAQAEKRAQEQGAGHDQLLAAAQVRLLLNAHRDVLPC